MADTRSFDDRDGWIWIDGKLVPWREANVHILTHAMHYASSVFEGQRAYGGVIFKLSEHSARLRKSAELLGFELPWSVEEIDAACNEVVKANGLTDAYVRPVAWLRVGEDGRFAQGHQAAHGDRRLGLGQILSRPRSPRRACGSTSRRGAARRLTPRRCISKAAGLYMIASLSKKHADERGYDDALMFDWRGQVAEATGANAFFVKEGKLFTPTPDCFLNGITRQTVMDLARRRGVEVDERAIWPDELESFEQMFITGSAAEVTFIRSAGPWNFEIGDLSRQLAKDYDDLVNRRLNY